MQINPVDIKTICQHIFFIFNGPDGTTGEDTGDQYGGGTGAGNYQIYQEIQMRWITTCLNTTSPVIK